MPTQLVLQSASLVVWEYQIGCLYSYNLGYLLCGKIYKLDIRNHSSKNWGKIVWFDERLKSIHRGLTKLYTQVFKMIDKTPSGSTGYFAFTWVMPLYTSIKYMTKLLRWHIVGTVLLASQRRAYHLSSRVYGLTLPLLPNQQLPIPTWWVPN